MENLLTNIISSLVSGLLGATAGAWLAFRYQRKSDERNELKEFRNRFIIIRSEMEAYEYILKTQYEDLHRVAYRYAFKYNEKRLTGKHSDLDTQELADRLEKTRAEFELRMFDFRKLFSELKGLTNEQVYLTKIFSPILTQDFDKWNLKFNRMEEASEFLNYVELNMDDNFGQGGKSIEPGLTIHEMKMKYHEYFKLVYIFIDKRIQELMPKTIIERLKSIGKE